MFDIGFPELLLLSIVALLVLGPERLPGAIRTVSLAVARLRRSFRSIQGEIERELQLDEIRREVHNQGVLADIGQARQELEESLETVRGGARETEAELRSLAGGVVRRGSPDGPPENAEPDKGDGSGAARRFEP